MVKWQKQWTREYTLYKMETVVLPLFSPGAKKFLGRPIKNIAALKDGDNATLYLDEDEIKKGIDYFYEHFCQSTRSFKKYKKIYLNVNCEFLKFSYGIYKMDFSKLNNNDFIKILNKFLKLHNKHLIISQWLVYYLADMLTVKIQSELRNDIKEPEKIKDYLKIIFTPAYYNKITREYIDLLKLTHKYKLNKISNKNFNKELNLHALKYQWFPVLDINDRPWRKNHFKKEFKKVLKGNPEKILKELKEQFNQSKGDWQNLIRNGLWSNEQKRLFKMAHLISFYKDDRDDNRRQAYFYLQKMYEELAKRLNITLNEFGSLMHKEIIKGLKGGIAPGSIIRNRKKFYLLLLKNKKIKVYTGQRAKDLARKIIGQDQGGKNMTKITGTVAFHGEVNSIAKIIKTKSDLSKIKQGDIMIAITTHPDFLYAMKKCSAIITDEGSILSHAAIVSREFKLPCIVNTKIATQILKDGDLVEVDANRGVVKIIKKAK